MSGNTLGIVLGGLAALGGLSGLAALFKVFFDRTQIRADAVDRMADTSVKLLAPLHSEIDRLSSKLRAAEQEVDDLRKQMRAMAAHNEEIGALQSKLRERQEEIDTLRSQIREMYRDNERKDRTIADRDREIDRLRGGAAT